MRASAAIADPNSTTSGTALIRFVDLRRHRFVLLLVSLVLLLLLSPVLEGDEAGNLLLTVMLTLVLLAAVFAASGQRWSLVVFRDSRHLQSSNR